MIDGQLVYRYGDLRVYFRWDQPDNPYIVTRRSGGVADAEGIAGLVKHLETETPDSYHGPGMIEQLKRELGKADIVDKLEFS